MHPRFFGRPGGAPGSGGDGRSVATAVAVAAVLVTWAGTGVAQSAPASPAVADAAARLRHLDGMLSTAEAQLRERGARVVADAEAGRRGAGGTLVVLLRADAAARGALGSATLTLDETQVGARAYYAAQRDAFAAGGVDELYRGAVLLSPHALALTVVAGGQPVSRTVTVAPAADGRATYVEFAVRGTGLEVASWLGGAPSAAR